MKHIFDIEIAEQYGINAAILLENIGFWTAQSEANEINFHDGSYWTFNSCRALQELFPYMSKRQIHSALEKLINDGLIVTGNYNKVAYDRTLWYTLTQKGKSILHFGTMDFPKKENRFSAEVTPIPDINTDIINTPFIIPPCDDSAPAKQQTRHKYGTYQNVLLSDADYEKLKSEFPTDYNERIERVSEYVAMNGKKYKDFLAVIRNWARRDTPKEKPRYM